MFIYLYNLSKRNNVYNNVSESLQSLCSLYDICIGYCVSKRCYFAFTNKTRIAAWHVSRV